MQDFAFPLAVPINRVIGDFEELPFRLAFAFVLNRITAFRPSFFLQRTGLRFPQGAVDDLQQDRFVNETVILSVFLYRHPSACRFADRRNPFTLAEPPDPFAFSLRLCTHVDVLGNHIDPGFRFDLGAKKGLGSRLPFVGSV